MSVSDGIKRLRTEVATLNNQAKTLYAELEVLPEEKRPADQREKLNNLIDAGAVKVAELAKLEELDRLDQATNPPAEDRKAKESPGERAVRKSLGDKVIESKAFKDRGSGGATVRFGDELSIKAVYSGTDASGGYFVEPMRVPEVLDIVRMRPRSVIDMVNQSRTTVDAVEYLELTTRTENAAVVPEFTAGNFGLKPESNRAWNERTAVVKTIAAWIAASRQILSDAPRLRDMIDGELVYEVERELEDQVLTGDGVGNNFTGILNWSGIQSRVHATSGRDFDAADTIAISIRRALTDIQLEFYEPTAVVMHPADAELMEVDEYTAKRFTNAFDPVTLRVWRVPIVITQAITSHTALVGNFRLGATLWDRQGTEIRVGEPNDFFLRNALAVLAELRAAFAVTRPLAFAKVTGLAAAA